MFRNLKRKFAKVALTVMALQLAVMGLGTGATGAYAADYTGVIGEFTLYNSTSNEEIQKLEAGDKINIALPEIGNKLNVVAETVPEDVGSVWFELRLNDVLIHTRKEGVYPYALMGDSPTGDYLDWTPAVGRYILTAIPCEGSICSATTGVHGEPMEISFNIYDDIDKPFVETAITDSYLLNEDVVASYNPLVVDLTFSEVMDVNVKPVLTFTPDISNSVTCTGKWVDGDKYEYTCTLTDADVELAGVTGTISGAQDLAGNLQKVYAPDADLDIDTKAPTAEFSAATPGNSSVIPATITFSEPVVGFDATKLTVTGGTVENLIGGPLEYKFDVVPTDPSAVADIKVDLLAGVVTDVAVNDNLAAKQLVISFDGEAPKAVTGLTTFVDNAGHVKLSWINPTAGTYTTLRVVRDGAMTIVLDPSDTTYLDMTTVFGGTYKYVVIVGDAAGNETGTSQVTVNVPAQVVAAVVSDSYVPEYNDISQTTTDAEEVKADTTTGEDDATEEDEAEAEGFPVWGIILLLILAAVGGYLIWNQKPAPAVAPVATKKKNTSNKKK